MKLEDYYTGERTALYNVVLNVQFSEEGDDPVTTADFKAFAAIDVDDNDTQIPFYLKAARTMLEKAGNISLITRTITASLKTPNGEMRLPYGPVNDISSVIDSKKETIDEDDYTFTGSSIFYGSGKFTAEYTAGYGEDSASGDLPADLKMAILAQAQYLYDNRGATDITTTAQMILKGYAIK